MGWTVYNSDGQILQGSAALADASITNAKLATSAITGAPDLGEAPATGDSLLISDTSASAALKEITVANLFAAPAITGNATAVTQSASNNSTRIATTAYVDAQVATEDTIAELNDTTITSIASGEVLKWNGSAWVNNTLAELGVLPVANPVFTGTLTVGSATVTEAQLEILDGATVTTAELNLLDGVSGLVQADLTKLAAIDSTAAEINLLDALDRGSILYGNSSGVTTVLGQGTTDQVLTSDGTDISWEDAGGGPTEATKAHIQDKNSGTRYVPPDLMGYHHGVAKAWGQAGDTGVLASPTYNLTSMGKTSTGVFLITFAEDFDDQDLSGGFQGRDNHGFAITVGESVSDVGKTRIRTYDNDGTLADKAIGFVFFGTQADP